MLKRKTSLRQKTQLKRKTPLNRHSNKKSPLTEISLGTSTVYIDVKDVKGQRYNRISPISDRRREQKAEYAKKAAAHLKAHPYCQIAMARFGINEKVVIENNGVGCMRSNDGGWEMVRLAKATEIHHRLKRWDKRLVNDSFFMSASRNAHRWAEANKSEARRLGILCPINCDPNGKMPDGSQCLTTDELLAIRAAGKDDTTK